MERRDLLKLIASATGMAMIGAPSLAFGYTPPSAVNNAFSDSDVAKLDEIAEIIIPRTDTPGAKDAGVGLFMAQYVTDCYTPEEQATFRSGLVDIDARTEGRFLAMAPAARTELLRQLDTEAKTQAADGTGKAHYFTMFKQLTLFSFFTSEVGATKVLRYVAVPGYYDGDMPYEQRNNG